MPLRDASELVFQGQIWRWVGPAPHHFVSVPADHVDFLRAAARFVTYGWGMIPVRVRIGRSVFTTSLFPKDGGYVVPLKASVREAEGLAEGDTVELRLEVHAR